MHWVTYRPPTEHLDRNTMIEHHRDDSLGTVHDGFGDARSFDSTNHRRQQIDAPVRCSMTSAGFAQDAVQLAVADAGLAVRDIDGLLINSPGDLNLQLQR